MATTLELANLALSYLGDVFITEADLTTPSTTDAQLVVNVLSHTTDEILAEHDWDFSTFWSSALMPVSGRSSPDYDFYFDLPDGTGADPYCLLVRATNHDDDEEPWRVEGRTIALSRSNSVQIRYRARVALTTWHPKVVTACAYAIAAKIAYAITESQSVTDQMMRLAEFTMKQARVTNGMEGPARATRTRSLIDVRTEG